MGKEILQTKCGSDGAKAEQYESIDTTQKERIIDGDFHSAADKLGGSLGVRVPYSESRVTQVTVAAQQVVKGELTWKHLRTIETAIPARSMTYAEFKEAVEDIPMQPHFRQTVHQLILELCGDLPFEEQLPKFRAAAGILRAAIEEQRDCVV